MLGRRGEEQEWLWWGGGWRGSQSSTGKISSPTGQKREHQQREPVSFGESEGFFSLTL